MRKSYEFITQEVMEKHNEEEKQKEEPEQYQNNFNEFMDRTQKIIESSKQMRESYTMSD